MNSILKIKMLKLLFNSSAAVQSVPCLTLQTDRQLLVWFGEGWEVISTVRSSPIKEWNQQLVQAACVRHP